MNRSVLIALVALPAVAACKKNMPPVVAQHFDELKALVKAAHARCDEMLAMKKCPSAKWEDLEERQSLPPMPASPLSSAPALRELQLWCIKKLPDGFHESCHFRPIGDVQTVTWTCPAVATLDGWPKALDSEAAGETMGKVGGPECKEDLFYVYVSQRTPGGNQVIATADFHASGRPPK